ncbi:MAG: Dyp-type peroxidase [Thermomicrobiales bacterium]|nr:Dyp-type peroxidase [Thermomicrobiales bacterium]
MSPSNPSSCNDVHSQPILTPLTPSAMFLVMTIRPGGESTVRDLLADLGGLQRSVGFRAADDFLVSVVGIGSDAWDRLYSGPRPPHLHPFQPITGAKHNAPATPGDLLFHIRALRADLCFALAALIAGRLEGAVDVVDEVHGFRYFDARDLLGFVDGTENPTGSDAVNAVIVGNDDPFFCGGSYVIVQKYLHDLDRWNAIPVEEQEKIIGRTKLDDVELDDAGPSHVTLNTIVDAEGVEHDIVRDNMPFGHVGTREYGTYYIGYAADPSIIEQMLQRMFVGSPPGSYDRILDVSTPVTGTFFAVPTIDFLENPPPAPNREARNPAP